MFTVYLLTVKCQVKLTRQVTTSRKPLSTCHVTARGRGNLGGKRDVASPTCHFKFRAFSANFGVFLGVKCTFFSCKITFATGPSVPTLPAASVVPRRASVGCGCPFGASIGFSGCSPGGLSPMLGVCHPGGMPAWPIGFACAPSESASRLHSPPKNLLGGF